MIALPLPSPAENYCHDTKYPEVCLLRSCTIRTDGQYCVLTRSWNIQLIIRWTCVGSPPSPPCSMPSLHYEESHRFRKSTGQFGGIFSLMIT